MNAEKEKIIKFGKEYFFKNGFYKTTMDEAASLLKMSKKTIYKNFSSKEELISEVVQSFIKQHTKKINQIVSEKQNAVVKLHLIMEYLGNFSLSINEKWLYDLQHYAPKIWKNMDEFRKELMTKNLTKLIAQGKKEKLIVDKPSEIIVNIFTSSIRNVISSDFIMNNKFSVSEALENTVEILMHGILTSKGEKLFNKINVGANK